MSLPIILPVHPVFLNGQAKEMTQVGEVSPARRKSASVDEKADFLNKLSSLDLYRPTRENIEQLFSLYGFDRCFSRLVVMRDLGIQRSNAGTFMAKLQTLNLVEPVQGEGRGKFRFKAR